MDDGTLELKAYMSSGLYIFLRECESGGARTYRVFRYRNSSRPYLLRLHSNQLVDPKTYVVVSSYRKPAGNYQHAIAEAHNNASRITLCPTVAQLESHESPLLVPVVARGSIQASTYRADFYRK